MTRRSVSSAVPRTESVSVKVSGLLVRPLSFVFALLAVLGFAQAQPQPSMQSLLAANADTAPCTPLLLAQLWSVSDQGLERIAAEGRQRECEAPVQAALAQPGPAILSDSAPAGERDWVIAIDAAIIADGRAWHRSTSWRHDGSAWQPEGDLLRAITPWEYQQFQHSLDELNESDK